MLATQKIKTSADRFHADVEGDIENLEGVLRITEIRVHYVLEVAREEQTSALWALENYIDKCPGAMSVRGCIRLEHSLELVTMD